MEYTVKSFVRLFKKSSQCGPMLARKLSHAEGLPLPSSSEYYGGRLDINKY
jgi:hypothetical protein